ncbi:Spy/CpxP family protein refolding chaperone [Motiliproteus sp.]|uniref:Spy/CpxP family protein refolding chaperone n=1 Tax=Motiliproteus sp. TaxID=1898955 RepID=UPI003BAC8E90
MKKQILIATTIIALGGGAALTLADGYGYGGCGGKGGYKGGYDGKWDDDDYREGKGWSKRDPERMQQRMLDKLDRKLELTAEQREQISTLMAKKFDSMRDAYKDRGPMRDQWQALDPSAADYTEQVEKLAKERAQSMADRMMERAQYKADLYSILTPEQQQEFAELEQRFSKRGWRH